jgi:hypothetical protein
MAFFPLAARPMVWLGCVCVDLSGEEHAFVYVCVCVCAHACVTSNSCAHTSYDLCVTMHTCKYVHVHGVHVHFCDEPEQNAHTAFMYTSASSVSVVQNTQA